MLQKRFIFILIILSGFSGVFQAQNDLALREDIGEMLLVGFRGQRLSDCPHIKRDIEQYHVGSVILFEYDAPTGKRHRNIASPIQLRQLCQDLQTIASKRLLIGIDQEGGRVCRMRAIDGFPRIASPQYTASQGMDTVRHYARLTAKMLQHAGVNFDFAPVADVDVNPYCPVIGKLERSFSADTHVVASCCRIWLDELARQNVIGCLKHFPGHGSASGDTHAGLVDVTKTWKNYELTPYKELLAEGRVPAIMVAHVINRQIDPQWPASLSHKTITELLRTQMGFDGVVVTDDLAMGAIIQHYDYPVVIQQAILAGADLLCLSNNGINGYDSDIVPKTVNIILQLVADGIISEQQIHASAERVRTLKKRIQNQKSNN
ncbi:MAG: hypothetical protein IJ764_04550 [Bacteroidales bacterium]|nr:hypothetical protein [Bacteroidales bacterium]